jgi:ribonucleoside-diphosphate reductase alpha chain
VSSFYSLLSNAGERVFNARFALKDHKGLPIETFEQAVHRLAAAAASAEEPALRPKYSEQFTHIIGNRLFIPSSPIWANIGKLESAWQPSACFVLSVEDSLSSMYETLALTAQVFKSGGGVGYNFSTIRPKGDIVRSTKGKASGVVELIRLYDASSNMVMQGGMRRGASIAILNIDHPEILEFINVKRSGGLTNFNLSVGVTDAFMRALHNNADWPLVFNKKTYAVLPATKIWDEIASAAHACGDPGVLFLNRIQEGNPVPSNTLNATNPCITGDSLIQTSEGMFRVTELIGQQFKALVDGVPWLSGVNGFFETGTKPIVKLITDDGYSLRLTPDHKILRADNTWVPAADLRPGERIRIHDHRQKKYPVDSEQYQKVFTTCVYSIEPCGVDKVYDVQIPGINAFDANGLYVHNCGEQPLSAGESCLLGSINLAQMISQNGRIDKEKLRSVVSGAVRFLDNLIDIAEYPVPLITEATKATRKIGLGFTGLADALIKAELAYDSPEGREYAAEITNVIQTAAHKASQILGKEKGCFPAWENSFFYPQEKRRNASCVTIAPTGSVTTIAGSEGYGVEPIFAVAYEKSTDVAGTFAVFSPLFLEVCSKHNIPASVLSEVASRGSCQNVEGIPRYIAMIFKGAQEIHPMDHLLMQAAVQEHVCNAVSKTVNLPASATCADISDIYSAAFRLNLKGVTVFRDTCKQGVIEIGANGANGASKEQTNQLVRGTVRPRPKVATGKTVRLDTGCGKLYLTANSDPTGKIFETFITTGSDGGCFVYTETTSRLISLVLRAGVPIEEIIEQLQSAHSCPAYMLARGKGKPVSPGKSCASAIALCLAKIASPDTDFDLEEATKNEIPELITDTRSDTLKHSCNMPCPDCGDALEMAEGCAVCKSCGYSKC